MTVSMMIALALPRSNDYDVSQFTFEKTVANTFPTLLALVSQLVSNVELNKSAVTLSQCTQQHISNSTNQTTLGLAVNLQHKFGSSELVKLLNDMVLSQHMMRSCDFANQPPSI